MSPQYGELEPTSSWDRSGSLGHPCWFQWVSRLGSVTGRYSSSGRKPNFAAYNGATYIRQGGHHVAHILVFKVLFCEYYSLVQTWSSSQLRRPTRRKPWVSSRTCSLWSGRWSRGRSRWRCTRKDSACWKGRGSSSRQRGCTATTSTESGVLSPTSFAAKTRPFRPRLPACRWKWSRKTKWSRAGLENFLQSGRKRSQ